MAYTNKFPVAAAVAVLFLAVTITPQWTEAQNTDTNCTVAVPVVEHCYTTLTESSSPSKECCKDLKAASETDVSCLCYKFIGNTSIWNETRALYYRTSISCNVIDKFRCGKLVSHGGVTNKIAASMSLFALVSNLLF